MSWWSDLTDAIKQRRGNSREIFSAAFPFWDIGALQYPTANPYTLANEGYTKNELVYACIGAISNAISEAPLWEYDDTNETPEEIPHSPLRDLLEHPAPNLTEEEFWKITEITLKTAGFCVWEKVRPNVGKGVAELGYLRTDWVSFKRGKGKAIEAVAYSPPGYQLDPKPAEEFVIFQYFDPRNPFTKGLSPMAIALRMTSVDNSATDFLKLFFQHGAVFNGILTTDMQVTEQESKRIKDGWKIAHGGVQNWADIAVLGKNVKYQQTQMDFEQMAFQSLDQRSEGRILTVFNVPLQIIGTTLGAKSSTYANYQEAKLSFYQNNIKPEWRYLAGIIREQLQPEFHVGQNGRFYVEFQTQDIQALQPNRDAAVLRAEKMYTAKIWSRDEAREETDKDSIDGDWNVFADGTRVPKPGIEGAPAPHPIFDKPKELSAQTQVTAGANENDKPNATVPAEVEAAKALERKQFKTFVSHGRDPNKFQFKHLTTQEQRALKVRNDSPRDFKRILFVLSLEQMHPDSDRQLTEDSQDVARILDDILPTTFEIIREPHELTPILARFDAQDTLVMDWTDSEAASALVEQAGFAHTSSPPATQALVFDREKMFLALRQHRIRVPEFMMVYAVDAIDEWTKYPAVMRPNECHGSEDMCEVGNPQEAKDAFEKIVLMHPRKVILMEKISPAREFSVGLWNDGRVIETLPISETNMAALSSDMKDEDFKAPSDPTTVNEANIIPAQLSADLENKLRLQSIEIFKFFGISIYGRVDWRMYEGTGDPICIDVNPEPSIESDQALQAAMAIARGMSYADFIMALIHKAIDYYHNLDGYVPFTPNETMPSNGNGNGHGAMNDMHDQFNKAMQEFRDAMKANPGLLKQDYSIPITVNVPQPVVNVTNRIPLQQPPTVNVPAPVVNVAAPNVQVDNQVNPTPVEITNQVETPDVNVTNEVQTPMVVNRIEPPAEAPEPKTRQVRVKRGSDGKIAGFEEVVK